MRFLEEIIGILKQKVNAKVFDSKKRESAFKNIGRIGNSAEDVAKLETEMNPNPRYLTYNRKMLTLSRFCANIGFFDQAKEYANKIWPDHLDYKCQAYIFIAYKSGLLADFNAAIDLFNKVKEPCVYEKRSLAEDLACALAKNKFYDWATAFVPYTKYSFETNRRIAEFAFINNDTDQALRFYIRGNHGGKAVDIIKGYIEENRIEEARVGAGKIQDMQWGAYYSYDCFMNIYTKTRDMEDWIEATKMALACRGSTPPVKSSAALMVCALSGMNPYLFSLAMDEAAKADRRGFEEIMNGMTGVILRVKKSFESS